MAERCKICKSEKNTSKLDNGVSVIKNFMQAFHWPAAVLAIRLFVVYCQKNNASRRLAIDNILISENVDIAAFKNIWKSWLKEENPCQHIREMRQYNFYT
ncbi:hypothetical protein CAEBREN_23301 [Caenorhabditis brenneri]|uniref:Uncharacterized protein n=1 Tax=Caenorhabditis brenneri TaxID=135651 RepID=G0N060_CAEBE|nr:hypothetical protein CAEBREN_23301 [Caenorhabditis brenneri]